MNITKILQDTEGRLSLLDIGEGFLWFSSFNMHYLNNDAQLISLFFSNFVIHQVAAVGSFPSVIGQQLALSQSAVRGGGSAAEL